MGYLCIRLGIFCRNNRRFAKCGIKKTDSDAATAVRTIIVLAFSWLMVLIVGSAHTIGDISAKTWIFLVLSGIATGASWLCYFKALQTGDINKVVPIDKSSTVLTILLAFIFLGEKITAAKGISVVLIAAGTFMMIEKKKAIQIKRQQKRPDLCGTFCNFCRADFYSG